MKKKILFTLCALVAMLFLTSCGDAPTITDKMQNDSNVIQYITTIKVLNDGSITTYTDEDREFQLNVEDDRWKAATDDWKERWDFAITKEAYITGVKSYMACEKEVGSVISIKEMTSKFSSDGEVQTITILNCKNRNLKMIVTYNEKDQITAIAFNPIYTTGENMLRACLNTLMGMGVVFSVLILISLIISLFSFIPKIQKKMQDKKAAKSDSMDNTIQQIITKEEGELSDDCELVAVIAASIAAYEGTSTDGFVVRSIRKSANWQRS